MGQVRALAAAITLCAVACAGCSAAAPRRSIHVVSPTPASQAPVVTSPADCDPGGTAALARPRQLGRARSWPERLVARDSPASVAQAFDPLTRVVYTLVGRPVNGSPAPYALACTSLRTGAVQRGPVFQASSPPQVHGFAIASGYLWVSLTLSQPVARQVDLRDLAVVRSLRLPTANPTCDLGVTIAAGPADSAAAPCGCRPSSSWRAWIPGAAQPARSSGYRQEERCSYWPPTARPASSSPSDRTAWCRSHRLTGAGASL